MESQIVESTHIHTPRGKCTHPCLCVSEEDVWLLPPDVIKLLCTEPLPKENTVIQSGWFLFTLLAPVGLEVTKISSFFLITAPEHSLTPEISCHWFSCHQRDQPIFFRYFVFICPLIIRSPSLQLSPLGYSQVDNSLGSAPVLQLPQQAKLHQFSY